jgi:hypothetical protein
VCVCVCGVCVCVFVWVCVNVYVCVCVSSCDSCFMYLCYAGLIIGHCSVNENGIRLNYVQGTVIRVRLLISARLCDSDAWQWIHSFVI